MKAVLFLLVLAGCSSSKKYDVLQAPAPRTRVLAQRSAPPRPAPKICVPSLPPCEITVSSEDLEDDCPGGCCRLKRD